MYVKIIIKDKFENEGEHGKSLRGKGRVEVIYIECLHILCILEYFLLNKSVENDQGKTQHQVLTLTFIYN